MQLPRIPKQHCCQAFQVLVELTGIICSILQGFQFPLHLFPFVQKFLE
jgi:hypothetical protein